MTSNPQDITPEPIPVPVLGRDGAADGDEMCPACLRPTSKPSACIRPHRGGTVEWRPHPRTPPPNCGCPEGAQLLVWSWCEADDCDGHPRCVRCGAKQICSPQLERLSAGTQPVEPTGQF